MVTPLVGLMAYAKDRYGLAGAREATGKVRRVRPVMRVRGGTQWGV